MVGMGNNSTAPTGLQGTGVWFDGKSSQRRPAHLLLEGDLLRIAPDVSMAFADGLPGTTAIGADAQATGSNGGLPMRHKLKRVRISERWDHAPLALALPDGSTLWVDDEARSLADALVDRVQRLHPRRLPSAARLIASWPAVLASLVATLVLLAWFDRQGASLAAQASMVVVPKRVDRAIGDAVFSSVKSQWLAPTAVPQTRQEALKRRFDGLARAMEPAHPAVLHFFRSSDDDDRAHQRKAPEAETEDGDATTGRGAPRATTDARPEKEVEAGGFNAFALPNGAIVMLDGMTQSLTDDEIMAVLGHELGHVVHRHSMQSVMRSIGLLAVAGAVFGDFSTVVSTAVATLQTFHHSRDAEREADVFGRRFAKFANLPAGTEAAVWRKLLAQQEKMGLDDLPVWMSTHPPTQERLEAAQRP